MNAQEQMIEKLKDLVSFSKENGFTFFLTVAKDGEASNYVEGDLEDLELMFISISSRHELARKLIRNVHLELKNAVKVD